MTEKKKTKCPVSAVCITTIPLRKAPLGKPEVCASPISLCQYKVIPIHRNGIFIRYVEIASIIIPINVLHTHPRLVRLQVVQIEGVVIANIDDVGLIGTHLRNGARVVQGACVVGVNRWVYWILVAGVIEVLNVAGSVVVQDV